MLQIQSPVDSYCLNKNTKQMPRTNWLFLYFQHLLAYDHILLLHLQYVHT